MHKIRVGVLRGGPSAEYDVSLKTGQSVLQSLPQDRYDVKDVLIDRNGKWHMRGMAISETRVLDQFDVLFNALHGAYGEDGVLQRYLDQHGSKYTGSGALSSALAMNKTSAKEATKSGPCKHARHAVFDENLVEEDILNIFRTFQQPSVVKPLSGGSSVSTTLSRSYDQLKNAIVEILLIGDRVLIEEYVRGREATVAVVEGFRGEQLYAFPPIEIVCGKSDFFDYDEKYSGVAREICPAPFPRETTEALLEAAKYVHRTLGLRDYSRSDFIVAKDGIYFLEVNTLPGLTPESLVPKAVDAVGATLPQFLSHLVDRAYMRKR